MRFIFAVVLAVSATPALAELECTMQHGRLVCDYAAALAADAAKALPADDATMSLMVPAAYSDANVYDTASDASAAATLCLYTPLEEAAGC
jgi:hypothetical protein